METNPQALARAGLSSLAMQHNEFFFEPCGSLDAPEALPAGCFRAVEVDGKLMPESRFVWR